MHGSLINLPQGQHKWAIYQNKQITQQDYYNWNQNLIQLCCHFNLLQKMGIGFDLKGITKGEMSVGFMLDLKKSNNIMSFHETISAIVLQLKKIHKNKKQREVEKKNQGKFVSINHWSMCKIPTSKVLSKVQHVAHYKKAFIHTTLNQLPNFSIHTIQ